MQHVQHEHIDVVMAGASSAPGQQLSLGGDQQAIRRQPVLPGRQFIAKQAHKPNSGLAFVEVSLERCAAGLRGLGIASHRITPLVERCSAMGG